MSGGTSWLSAAKTSAVGRNRNAAFGMRNALLRFAISIFTFAVMPGFNLRSRLGTVITVPYVVTFCTTTGCRRICVTVPRKLSVG
ncbi:hypothetical protein D3C83_119460 [compost metagenome]